MHSSTLELIVAAYGPAEDRKVTVARYDRILKQMVDISKVEPYRSREPWKEYYQEIRANTFVSVYMSDLRRIVELFHRHRSEVRGTVAGIAVLRYKAETGTLPTGWEDVVKKGYLKETPIDVFSGNALVYKKTSEGFMIYSVREDGKDDGGDRRKDRVYWPAER